MTTTRVLGATALAVAFLVLVVKATLPEERLLIRLEAPQTADARLTFSGTRRVFQTIRGMPGGIARLDVPMELPLRPNAYPLIVHIKESRNARSDIRTLYVTERNATKTDGVLSFRFLASPTTKEPQDLVVVFDAPNAHPEEFAVYREQDSTKYPEGQLHAGERMVSGNIALRVFIRQPAYRFALSDLKRTAMFITSDVTTIERDAPLMFSAFSPSFFRALKVGLGGLAAALVALLVSALPSVRRWLLLKTQRLSSWERAFIACCALAAFLVHVPYILSYPIVNDEGAYLMDIANLRDGAWPFRDFLTKGPVFLLAILPAALAHPPSVVFVRVVIAAAASLGAALSALLARRLWGRTAGVTAGILSAFTPAVVAQSSQIFLQPIELLFVTSAFLLTTPRFRESRAAASASRLRFLIAGMVLAFGYLTRVSALAFLPTLAAFAVAYPAARWRTRFTRGTLLVGGCLGTLVLLFSFAAVGIGWRKAAVLFNLEAVVISGQRAEQGHAYTLTDLFTTSPRETIDLLVYHGRAALRTGFPVILFWFVALVTSLLWIFRIPRVFTILLIVGASAALWQPLREIFYQANGDMSRVVPWVLLSLTGALTIAVVSTVRRGVRDIGSPWRDTLLLGGTWGILALLYMSFGRFRQHYHPEFLFLYILGSARCAAGFVRHTVTENTVAGTHGIRRNLRAAFALSGGRLAGTSIIVLTAIWFAFGHLVALSVPHVGKIPLRTAEHAARAIRLHSEPGSEIFTAQAILPYLAERKLPFSMSHPGWYLEERAGTLPASLRRLYFPDRDVLRSYVERLPIKLIVLDQRTKEVYFAPDPELERTLQREFALLQSFEVPGERPIELWQRRE